MDRIAVLYQGKFFSDRSEMFYIYTIIGLLTYKRPHRVLENTSVIIWQLIWLCDLQAFSAAV